MAHLQGKRVGQTLYIHRTARDELEAPLRDVLALAEDIAQTQAWSVAKLQRGERRVSLLTYEDFEHPFPALLESLTIDLEAGAATRRTYRKRTNPPVLHRKELLLRRDDPRRARYGGLTRALEDLGLLRDSRFIGTRRAWDARLAAAGVRVIDHQLVNDASDAVPVVRRHLAAIARDGFSAPIQALLRHGVIGPGTSVLDYGCGRGSDVEGLRQAGVAASGWDPYYAPDTPRSPADVVNLGFVLNVIERPGERLEVLDSAFALARGCLAIAVITASNAQWDRGRPLADGLVTRRGTFQKFYADTELQTLLEARLQREAFRVAAGVYLVFKDPLLEQAFLLQRQTRQSAGRPRLAPWRAAEARRAKIEPQLHVLAAEALARAREPLVEEVEPVLIEALDAANVSFRQACRWAFEALDPVELDLARTQRRDDLRVYFALNIFNRRQAYRDLPASLQADVKALFGGFGPASEAGRDLLFSLGRPDLMRAALAAAHAQGLGWRDEEGALFLDARLLDHAPAALRCLAGCARRYHGGLEDAHLIKLHRLGDKVSAMTFERYEALLPVLSARIKVDLARQRIQEFNHRGQDQRLLARSRVMSVDLADWAAQRDFDQRLLAAWPGEAPLYANGQALGVNLAQAGFPHHG
ncbi:DNA phosphorothioation-associated putative methyltransferase [Caulobacter sp.]|uniref:DNA phosphorothioation-associated putative methyltransferase n=1 Tax=Caulobacter sp. TaxID=78 RepID=UPI003BA8A6BD